MQHRHNLYLPYYEVFKIGKRLNQFEIVILEKIIFDRYAPAKQISSKTFRHNKNKPFKSYNMKKIIKAKNTAYL